MSERFAGRRVLVSGAGAGIGAAIAARFHAEGATVTGSDLDEAGLAARAEELGADRFLAVVADVGTAEGRARMIEVAAGPEGRIDAVINNAAAFVFAGVGASDEEWQRSLDVNLLAPAKLVSEALPALRRSDRASVVNIASISGHVAQSGSWIYNTTKGGLLQLTRSQALDLGADDVRVNSISPGWIWSAKVDEIAEGDRERWEPTWGEYCIMKRCGEPSEVAAVAAFLCSDDATFITGADIAVDGGYRAIGPERVAPLGVAE